MFILFHIVLFFMTFATVANFLTPLASGAVAAVLSMFSVFYYVSNKDNQEVRFRLKSVYQASPILFVGYFVLFQMIGSLTAIPLAYVIYHSYMHPRVIKNPHTFSDDGLRTDINGKLTSDIYDPNISFHARDD